MKSKKELKEQAQDELMFGLQTAFLNVVESGTIPKEEQEDLLAEMSKQMVRIEKLFGYKPYSWNRGC